MKVIDKNREQDEGKVRDIYQKTCKFLFCKDFSLIIIRIHKEDLTKNRTKADHFSASPDGLDGCAQLL